jgi:hypothetical protein
VLCRIDLTPVLGRAICCRRLRCGYLAAQHGIDVCRPERRRVSAAATTLPPQETRREIPRSDGTQASAGNLVP